MAITLPAALQAAFTLLGVEWPSEDENYIRPWDELNTFWADYHDTQSRKGSHDGQDR